MQNAKVEPAKCSSHSSESESDPHQIPAHFENSTFTVDSTSNQIFTQATYEAPPKVKKRMKTSDVDFNKEKTNLIVNYLPQVRIYVSRAGWNATIRICRICESFTRLWYLKR